MSKLNGTDPKKSITNKGKKCILAIKKLKSKSKAHNKFTGRQTQRKQHKSMK